MDNVRVSSVPGSAIPRPTFPSRLLSRRCVAATVSRKTGNGIEPLERRLLLTGEPVITEFMAKNDGIFEDGDGNAPDWIEVQNVGDAAIDLAGYRLTDKPRNLSRWVFPSVIVEPGQYLVVFASGQEESDYVDAGGNLHTNFSLSAGGEYLALVAPDGTIVSQFVDPQTKYPAQSANISYGIAQRQVLVNETSEAAYWVPTDGSVDDLWRQTEFDTAAHAFMTGMAALGYEGRPDSRNSFVDHILTTLPEEPAAVYARIEFDVTDGSDVTGLNLRMKYDDGFIAYLNGVKVAESNAPVVTTWASGATTRRTDRRAFDFQDFDLGEHVSQLQVGTNVLAIHGLAHEADRSGMLMVPQLVATIHSSDPKIGYMVTPTPGSQNVDEQSVFTGGMLDEASVSVEAGFFDAPFSVTAATANPGAQIRYTTDGSPPTATTGEVYTDPIQINTTTTLRVAAFMDDHIPSPVTTRSYIFLHDVIRQSNDQPGLPTRWEQPSYRFDADYEMDQDIVNDPDYRDDIIDGLRSIRTMSITIDPEDFLTPSGIYINTAGHGVESERPVSVEIINPDGTLAVQVNAGLRNHGNRTRDFDVTLKQSFRLVFSARNGPRKLEYPLFADSPVSRFDNIILHAGKILDDPQLVRNSFGRDTNRAMGNVDGHSTYVHLYFNGLYWGLYNPFERADAEFAQEYFGGSDEDYDAVLNNSELIDGSSGRFTAMWRMLRSGLATQEEYEEFQRQIDLNSLFDLLLVNQYMAHDEHESRAIGNREGDANFRFFIQDVDEGGMNRVRARTNVAEFLPARAYDQLRDNPETRLWYADRAHKHLFNGGALTPEAAAQRWQSRYQEIFTAVIGETARWGDTHWRSNFPRQAVRRDVELAREGTFLSETFFPQRTQVIIDQLRRSNIYPDVDAPTYNQFGGEVPAGFELMIGNPNEMGTIFYTLDGSDPRQFGGEAAPGALVHDGSIVPINGTVVVQARVLSEGEWSALSQAEFTIMSGDLNGDGEVNASDIDTLCVSIHAGDARFDLDQDGAVNQSDLSFFVQTVLQTDVGDSNLDGKFTFDDLRIEEYEDAIPGNSTWAEGDWNCDGDFNTADIVLAFRAGSFGAAAIPLGAFGLGDLAAGLVDKFLSTADNSLSATGGDQVTPLQSRPARDDESKVDVMATQSLNVESIFAPSVVDSAHEPKIGQPDRPLTVMAQYASVRDTLFVRKDRIEELLLPYLP